jgi:cytochrome c-type biogenesis protein CcmE
LLKKKKFLIGGVIIVLAIAYLGYAGFRGSATYYYTVDEVLQKGSSVYGQKLRVNGTVLDNSVKNESSRLVLEFSIGEPGKNIPVVYHGTAPDTFRPDTDVVVEGKIDTAGVLQASSILTKCPSKYVPQQ